MLSGDRLSMVTGVAQEFDQQGHRLPCVAPSLVMSVDHQMDRPLARRAAQLRHQSTSD
jgi:hypothetical protein